MLFNAPSINSFNNSEQAFIQRNAEALNRIAIFADLSEGFTIGFVEVNLERDREITIRALMSCSDLPNVQWIRLQFDHPDLVDLLGAIDRALRSQERILGKNLFYYCVV